MLYFIFTSNNGFSGAVVTENAWQFVNKRPRMKNYCTSTRARGNVLLKPQKRHPGHAALCGNLGIGITGDSGQPFVPDGWHHCVPQELAHPRNCAANHQPQVNADDQALRPAVR